MMPHRSESSRNATQMQDFFETTAQQVARATGFVQRTSKLDGAGFSQTLVLSCLAQPHASLNDMAQVSADLGVPISAEGLHSRINARSVTFMACLTRQALCTFQAQGKVSGSLLARFTKVNLVDSTLFKLPAFLADQFGGVKPAGGTAAMKVQLSYDYNQGSMNAIAIQPGHSADQPCRLPLDYACDGSLTLLDLGYFDQTTFASIAQSGAYFISRLQSQVALYETAAAKQALDRLTWLQTLPADCHETWLWMGHTARLPVRLVVMRLPAEVVEERRRKARATARRRGQTCSARTLALLAWALFVTNVPADWLSPAQVRQLYGLRWQIELIFKLWKSQAGMKDIGAWRVERVLCQFYARLLGVIVFQWLSAPYRFRVDGELSLPKAFAVFQRHASRLLEAVADHWQPVASCLDRIIGDFHRFARKTKRRKSPSTWQQFVLPDA